MTNRERARELVEACIALNGYDQVAEIAHCLNEAEARGRRQGLEAAEARVLELEAAIRCSIAVADDNADSGISRAIRDVMKKRKKSGI